MATRVKVLDLELSRSVARISGLSEYSFVSFLLRWHGRPLAWLKLPVTGDTCEPASIIEAICQQHSAPLWGEIVRTWLCSGRAGGHSTARDLFQTNPSLDFTNFPSISVAVCTRDRVENLMMCLSSLMKLEHPPQEILVIDNAPKNNVARELIDRFFPTVRYIVEPRPGLDWARNRAIAEAKGAVLAYTDDDVCVDSNWTKALAEIFASNSDVMAVTGLVIPYELETDAQILFEEYGGFGRGFDRKWYRATTPERSHLARDHAGAGKFGTGANMAFRRIVFSDIGTFDPALDVGTPTQGGGDLDMFFRVLKHGHTLVYEPAAVVRHRHRRDLKALHVQIASNGIGFYSHLVRNAISFPEERKGIAKLGLWWLYKWNLRRWVKALIKPMVFPRAMIWAELRGSFIGLFRYHKALRQSRALVEKFGPQFVVFDDPLKQSTALKALRYGLAVRTIDLAQGLRPLEDVREYFRTRIFVTWSGCALGQVDIDNRYRSISVDRLADEVVAQLGQQLFKPIFDEQTGDLSVQLHAALRELLRCEPVEKTKRLGHDLSVSIVVATRDRPDELRRCLESLVDQRTGRWFEVIVVDNNPSSNLTPPVVADFSDVLLVTEERQGLSCARNAGFRASSGEIIVCADDDIVAPPHWLETLVAPFIRNDVMLATGNVFPAELETASQVQFESYGGLGRGFEPREFNREWFDSFRRRAVPTWRIGATANTAIRAGAVTHPEIGLLHEGLGAGTPAGCSEDTYMFYRVLKAGYTIVYEPSAYVWHQHRRSNRALRRQIYSYSKGHVAYQLITFLKDRDCRGLVRVFAELPLTHARQIWKWLRGSRERSLGTILLEILGNCVGPFALWRSLRRARQNQLRRFVPIILGPADETFQLPEEPVHSAAQSNGRTKPQEVEAR